MFKIRNSAKKESHTLGNKRGLEYRSVGVQVSIRTSVMDKRLLAKPSVSSIETSPVTMDVGPSTSHPMGLIPQEFTTPADTYHPRRMIQDSTVNDQRLDTIIQTMKTMQESLRELHNEFSALKPRVATFQTSSPCPGMIVKSSSGGVKGDDYLKLLAKRKKGNK